MGRAIKESADHSGEPKPELKKPILPPWTRGHGPLPWHGPARLKQETGGNLYGGRIARLTLHPTGDQGRTTATWKGERATTTRANARTPPNRLASTSRADQWLRRATQGDKAVENVASPRPPPAGPPRSAPWTMPATSSWRFGSAQRHRKSQPLRIDPGVTLADSVTSRWGDGGSGRTGCRAWRQ